LLALITDAHPRDRAVSVHWVLGVAVRFLVVRVLTWTIQQPQRDAHRYKSSSSRTMKSSPQTSHSNSNTSASNARSIAHSRLIASSTSRGRRPAKYTSSCPLGHRTMPSSVTTPTTIVKLPSVFDT